MQFSLTGFTQSADLRTYAFEGGLPGQRRRSITVGVDIALARRYAISLQELPLLCLSFLEERLASSDSSTLSFSEREMRAIAGRREEAKRIAAMKHRPPRRPRPATAETRKQG